MGPLKYTGFAIHYYKFVFFSVWEGVRIIRDNSVRSYKQLELIAVVFILNTFECFL